MNNNQETDEDEICDDNEVEILDNDEYGYDLFGNQETEFIPIWLEERG